MKQANTNSIVAEITRITNLVEDQETQIQVNPDGSVTAKMTYLPTGATTELTAPSLAELLQKVLKVFPQDDTETTDEEDLQDQRLHTNYWNYCRR